jgi:hypothetical protein
MASFGLRLTGFAVLGLLTTMCNAAGRGAPPVPVSASAAVASSSVPARTKPLWPDDGVAQRRFKGGGVMFVEDDHDTRRAWVLSIYDKPAQIDHDHAWAEALDFFSGKVIKVKVVLEEDGSEDQAFIDSTGDVHVYTTDPQYPFSGTAMGLSLPGLDFAADNVFWAGTGDDCYVSLNATAPEKNYITGRTPPDIWHKIPIYHSVPFPGGGCRSGDLGATVFAALDLGDGTFLMSEGCFVFRLRKSDLSPVGAAPGLRVVDASAVKAAIADLHGKKVADATGYLIKALNLPASPEASCKAD